MASINVHILQQNYYSVLFQFTNSINSEIPPLNRQLSQTHASKYEVDRILSTTPGAEPPRDARDSGSARSHSTQLETSSSDRP